MKAKAPNVGPSKIFIGHGGSKVWLELEKFLKDRLNLPWDKFNTVSAAEDETPDGHKQARMNVVH